MLVWGMYIEINVLIQMIRSNCEWKQWIWEGIGFYTMIINHLHFRFEYVLSWCYHAMESKYLTSET